MKKTIKPKHFNWGLFGSIFSLIIIIQVFSGCNSFNSRQKERAPTLHIIHAGSLTHPVKLISEKFQNENPDVKILSEAWGSKAGARRIMEIETPCDVYLSADYAVIEHMLIPDHASWYIKFASNEMAIVYTPKSLYANEITVENWYEILLRPDVRIARSNPDHDPCGVRTVFTAKLSEIFYQSPGLANSLLEKDLQNVRPKETDLIALLESGQVDYIFLYLSVAQQHQLSWLRLPSALSQNDPTMENWYSQVSTETMGTSPGSTITETCRSMVYGLTIPKKSENAELALRFVAFVLDENKGMKILEELGQPSVIPSSSAYYNEIPEALQKFVIKQE